MKIQVWLCPTSFYVTRIPQLKQLIHASAGNSSNSITVHIDDSIRHDCCLVDGRCDIAIAKRLTSVIHEHGVSRGQLKAVPQFK